MSPVGLNAYNSARHAYRVLILVGCTFTFSPHIGIQTQPIVGVGGVQKQCQRWICGDILPSVSALEWMRIPLD